MFDQLDQAMDVVVRISGKRRSKLERESAARQQITPPCDRILVLSVRVKVDAHDALVSIRRRFFRTTASAGSAVVQARMIGHCTPLPRGGSA
jgi:hypothetical protein